MANKKSLGYQFGRALARLGGWAKKNPPRAIVVFGFAALLAISAVRPSMDSAEDNHGATKEEAAVINTEKRTVEEVTTREKREVETQAAEEPVQGMQAEGQVAQPAKDSEEQKKEEELQKPLVFSDVSWVYDFVKDEKLSTARRTILLPRLTITANVTNESEITRDGSCLPMMVSRVAETDEYFSTERFNGAVLPPHETVPVTMEVIYGQSENPRTFSFTEGRYFDEEYWEHHTKANREDLYYDVPFEGLDEEVTEGIEADFIKAIDQRVVEQDAINIPIMEEELRQDQERREAQAQEEQAYLASACWVTPSGSQYHKDPDCSYIRDKATLTEMTVEQARDAGYYPCDRCAH